MEAVLLREGWSVQWVGVSGRIAPTQTSIQHRQREHERGFVVGGVQAQSCSTLSVFLEFRGSPDDEESRDLPAILRVKQVVGWLRLY